MSPLSDFKLFPPHPLSACPDACAPFPLSVALRASRKVGLGPDRPLTLCKWDKPLNLVDYWVREQDPGPQTLHIRIPIKIWSCLAATQRPRRRTVHAIWQISNNFLFVLCSLVVFCGRAEADGGSLGKWAVGRSKESPGRPGEAKQRFVLQSWCIYRGEYNVPICVYFFYFFLQVFVQISSALLL